MSTGSINHNIKITDSADAERFVEALEKAKAESEGVMERLTPEQIEAQQQEIDQLKQNLKLQESLTMREMERVEVQRQEIEQLKALASYKTQIYEDVIDKMTGLIQDKDEQAGRIMRIEDGMRQVQHDIDGAECRDDLNGIKVFIDALLGGAEG